MKAIVHCACLTAACLVIVNVADARAQSNSAITGIVTDSDGAPVAGVSVRLQSESLAGDTQTAVTNKQGRYRFWPLQPGVYQVSTGGPNGEAGRRTGLLLSIGTTLTIDLVVGEASTTAAPMMDVTAAASTTRFGTKDLESLPISGATAILQLVPGITLRSAFGTDLASSEVLADGGPISVYGRGGGQVAAVHPYWMDEVQVVGFGAGAEYGEFNGVVASIAIRSGTDRTSGLFEYRTTPSRWVGDNTGNLSNALRVKFQPAEIHSRWDSTLQAGGPIGKHLFYFSGFHYERDLVRSAGWVTPLDERSPAFLTKLTWAPGRTVRVSGFVETNRLHAFGRLAPNFTPDTANDQTSNIRSWNGRAIWIPNSTTLIKAQAGSVLFDFHGIPEARRAGPPRRVDNVTGITSGNVAQFQDVSIHRHLAEVGLTRFLDGSAGRSHTLEVGLEVERATRRQFSNFPGGQSFTDADGVPVQVVVWEGDLSVNTGWRTTIFVQDAWSVGGRVTVHPGLRASVYRGSVPDKDTVLRTSPLSPRIGAAWDVTADHSTVIRAAYGRVHEALSPQLFAFMNTSDRTPRITYKVTDDTWVEQNRMTPDGNVGIADDLAHAAVDQYVVGIERQLSPNSSITLQYVSRNYVDIWGFIDTRSEYAPIQTRDPGRDNKPGTADDGAMLTVYELLNRGQAFAMLTNPDGAFRRYQALQAIGQKRFSDNWQLLAAYTWSRTRGNVTGLFGQTDAGQPDGVFFNPNRRINTDGRVSFDYPHQLTIQGVYSLPFWGGLGLSAEYSYLSGGSAGRLATISGLPQGNQTVRVEPRGWRRIEGASLLDVRVEKTFRLGTSTRTLGIFVDLLNTTNQGTPLAMTVNEQSGATFGEPDSWATPRNVRIAGRIKF